MLLLYPPVAKICEPPAGIAYLAGALRQNDISCTTVDLNIEAIHHTLQQPPRQPEDTWSKRAYKNRQHHLTSLQSVELYKNSSRYKRAVADINKLLTNQGKMKDVQLNLANFQDNHLLASDSQDLRYAFTHPEENIFYPFFSTRLSQLLKDSPDKNVGISLCYLSQALTTFAIAGYIKQNSPQTQIIVGGGLVTTWIRSPHWENPFTDLFDDMIAGPGEERILSLYGKQTELCTTRPDYTELSKHKYLSPGFILPYATSTGCFWNKCAFCPERAENAPFIPVKQDRITSDLAFLVAKHSPSLIHFLDNALSIKTMKTITATPPGPDWYGFARVSEQLSHPDFCKRLRQSGCIMLKLGIESGSQTVLDQMQKGITIALVSEALKVLHEAGIATYVYLLFGTPAETHEEAKKTLQFVISHQEQIDFLNLAIFNMPINSPESQLYPSRQFSDGDLSLYRDFSHPHNWDRKSIRLFLDKEFKQHEVIQSIIANDPPSFTSNHAPFFCCK